VAGFCRASGWTLGAFRLILEPMKGLTLGVGLLSSLANACSEGSCPPIAIPPVAVTVTDAVSRAEICDAVVTIASSAENRRFTSCPYAGGSGPSPFSVTVEKAGYETATIENIAVPPTEGDECPAQAKVTVTLAQVQR
jgi:hypothetical protein